MYNKLKINFEIPRELDYAIEQYLDDINNNRGHDDCWRDEINFCLKDWSNGLTPEQIDLLREYYVWQGIKKNNNKKS